MADGSVNIDIKVNGKQATSEINNIKKSFKTGMPGSGGGSDPLIKSSNSFKRFGVIAGLTSSVVSKGMSIIGNSVGGAVQRVDQLNRFPKVLQAMGFSAKDAQGSFQILDKGIRGLPTAMDDIQPLATQLANITGSAKKGAIAAVALNDAFLASGASAADTSRGLVQMNQMLAAGKVDMQSWKTLTETMSPALKKVAAGFGLVGKSAVNDLYNALNSGRIPMQDFLQKFVELDKAQNGFAQTAKIASAGINTSFVNMQTAIKRGIANIIQAIGTSNIGGLIEKTGKSFESVTKVICKLIESLKPFAPQIKAIGLAWAGIRITQWINDLGIVQNAFGLFLGKINSFKLGIVDTFKFLTTNIQNFHKISFDTNLFSSLQFGIVKTGEIAKNCMAGIASGSQNLAKNLFETTSMVVDFIGQGIGNLALNIRQVFSSLWGFVKQGGSLVKNLIATGFNFVWGAVVSVASSIGNAFLTLWSVVSHPLSSIQRALYFILDVFKLVGTQIWSVVSAIPGKVANLFSAIWGLIIQTGALMKNAIFAVGNGFKLMGNLVWNGIISLPGKILSLIKRLGVDIVSACKAIISTLVNTFSIIKHPILMLKTALSTVGQSFLKFGQLIKSSLIAVPGLISKVFSGIASAVSNPVSAIQSALAAIGASFKSLTVSLLSNPIGAIIAAIAVAVAAMAFAWKSNFAGIRDVTNSVFKGIISAFSPVTNAFKNLIKNINISLPNLRTLGDVFKGIGVILTGAVLIGLAMLADAFRVLADSVMIVVYSIKTFFDAITGHWGAVKKDFEQIGSLFKDQFDIGNSATVKTVKNLGKLNFATENATNSSKKHAKQSKETSKSVKNVGDSADSASESIENLGDQGKKSGSILKSTFGEISEGINDIDNELNLSAEEFVNNLQGLIGAVRFFGDEVSQNAKKASDNFNNLFTGNPKAPTQIEKYTQALSSTIDEFYSSMTKKRKEFDKDLQKASKLKGEEQTAMYKSLYSRILDSQGTYAGNMLSAEQSLKDMLVSNKTLEGNLMGEAQRQSVNEQLAIVAEGLARQNEQYVQAAEIKIKNHKALDEREMQTTLDNIRAQGEHELTLREANNRKIHQLEEEKNNTEDAFLKQINQRKIDLLNQANANSENRVADHYKKILNIISNGATGSVYEVVNGLQRMKGATAEELANVVGEFSKLNKNTDSKLQVFAAAMKNGGIEGADNFVTAIKSGDYEGALNSITPGIKDFMSRIPDTFFAGGSESKKKFIEALQNNAITPQLLHSIFELPLKNHFNQTTTEANYGGNETGTGFKKGLQKGLKGTSDSAKEEFDNVGNKSSQALLSGSIKAEKAAKTFQDTVIDVLDEIPDLAGNIGSDTANKYSNSAKKGAKKAKNASNEIKKGALDPLKETPKEAKKIGKNFGMGFANGISSCMGAVVAQSRLLAQKASDTVKRNLKIHSPSRVMKKVGVFFSQGFANGIVSLTNRVKEASTLIANASITAVNNALEIHSPSKKSFASGEYFGDGLADGIESKQQAVLEATKKLNDSVLKANEDFLKKAQDINKKLVDDISATQKAYEDKFKSTRDSIYNTINLFSEVKKLDEGEKPIGGNLLYNLGSQVELMQKFQQDLYTLLRRDVPEDLVKELQKMGINSANEVAAMTQMTADQLTQYIALWKQKNREAEKMAKWQLADDYNLMHEKIGQLKVNASVDFAKAKEEWLKQLRGLADDASKLGDYRFSGKVLGEDTVRGLIEGLKSMEGSLKQEATNLAKIVTNSIKNELKIASPSKVTRKLGEFTVEGVIVGIVSKFVKAKTTSQQLAKRIVEPLKSANTQFNKLQSMMSFQPQQRVENVQNYTTVNKLQGIVTEVNSRPIEVSVELDKETIAKVTAKPMDRHLGDIFSRNKRSLNFGGA